MTRRTIKTSFILIFIFLLSFTSNVFAAKLLPTMPDPVGDIQMLGDHLVMIGPNTGTFQYKVVDKHGVDITSQIPGSEINIDAFASAFGQYGSGGRTEASFDPRTGTCTLIYDFTDTDHEVTVSLGLRYGWSDTRCLYIGDIPHVTKVDEIKFVSDYLRKTGTNTATFQYKIVNFVYEDITKEIPSSQIDAFSSLDSKVTLDPSAGTGTITFNSPDIDKAINITLTDKLTGITAILNTYGKEPVKRVDASAISRINFVSSDLIKTGTDTATFNYKLLDHFYTDITNTIPATDIDATTSIGSSKGEISLDPSTGTGTITYDYSDTNKNAMVTLKHKTGVEASTILNIASSEFEKKEDIKNNNSEIVQIVFVSTDMINIGAWSELHYKLLNEDGKDVTPEIPASQIAVNSSVNSMITLKPSERICRIKYNPFDSDKTIIVSFLDKVSGAKAALNIGKTPADTGSLTDGAIVKFKDSVLEQAIRTLINKPTADILQRDVKNIPSLSVGQGCTDLSGIENLTGLSSLDLYSDKISDLSPLKGISNLGNLVYGADSISDIKSLVELTNLKFLDIKNTKISDEDLSLIKKALPNCYIYH